MRPPTPLPQITSKDRFKGMLVRHTEYAKGADQHMQVEGIHCATNDALRATSLHNAGDELHRPRIDARQYTRPLNMFGAMNILDRDQTQEVRVPLVVVERQLGELAYSGERVQMVDVERLLCIAQLTVGSFQDGDVQLLLAPEVVVDHALGRAHAIGDLVDART